MTGKALFFKKQLREYFKNKVSSSKGKGIDRLSTLDYESRLSKELGIIYRKIAAGTYIFSPYIENLKVKSRNRIPRLISIPSVRDRIVLYGLKEKLHEAFPDRVPRKRPNQLVKIIAKEYSTKKNLYYLKTDIKDFYSSINQQKLINLLKTNNVDNRITNLIQAAIKTATVPKEYHKLNYHTFLTKNGVPQGLAISNILAQIYLIPFDNYLNSKRVLHARYVDDIVIVGSKYMCGKMKSVLKEELKAINLKLNEDKTVIASFKSGMTFLGYNFENGKISISPTNIEKFIRSITSLFTWFKNQIAEKSKRTEWLLDDQRLKEVFLEYLNEKITGSKNKNKTYGWIFYFSEMNDLNLLFRIDEIINTQFKGLETFGFKSPDKLKRLVRAYYEIRFNGGGTYINDYNKYDTVIKKRKYLIYKGVISPIKSYTNKQINLLFNKHSFKMTKTLDIPTYGY